jgi:mRNA interferase MazF
MVVHQGDVFWVDFDQPFGSEPGYVRPCVVIQNDYHNQSRLKTVIVCALTSNLKWENAPGNVLLKSTEANLSKQSVVVVSQLYTIDKSHLGEYIGMLSARRIRQIIRGIGLLLQPREMPK